jgi:hypothetical protein
MRYFFLVAFLSQYINLLVSVPSGVYIKPILSVCGKCSYMLPMLQKENGPNITYVLPEANQSYWKDYLTSLLRPAPKMLFSDSLYGAIKINHLYSASLILDGQIIETKAFASFEDLKGVNELFQSLVSDKEVATYSVRADTLSICSGVNFSPGVTLINGESSLHLFDIFQKQILSVDLLEQNKCTSINFGSINLDSLYRIFWPKKYLEEYRYGDSVFRGSGLPSNSGFSSVNVRGDTLYVLVNMQDYNIDKARNALRVG